MPVLYKGNQIGNRRGDFLIDDFISVEIKALIGLKDVHLAQAINYPEAYNLEIGLLINFGSKSLELMEICKSFCWFCSTRKLSCSKSIITMKSHSKANNMSITKLAIITKSSIS